MSSNYAHRLLSLVEEIVRNVENSVENVRDDDYIAIRHLILGLFLSINLSIDALITIKIGKRPRSMNERLRLLRQLGEIDLFNFYLELRTRSMLEMKFYLDMALRD